MKLKYSKLLPSFTTSPTFPVINPATRQSFYQVPLMSIQHTKEAIEEANETFQQFRQTTPKERSNYLLKWYELMKQHSDDLATIITMECGKPFQEAKGEVDYAAQFLQFYGHECLRSEGFMIPTSFSGHRMMCIKQPIGVAAIITPWNFPLAMITRKLGPAFAAGCTAVVKPAEDTPLSALAMDQLATEAGVPSGALHVITSDREHAAEIGTELATHPLVRKLSFTGSTRVGKLLMEQCASTVKRVSLELGGNAPFIVFEDADIDAAVQGAMASKYRFSGQTCVCSNRFYIHANVYEEFVEKFTCQVKQLQVGNGIEEHVTTGPLIHAAALDKVHSLIQDALTKGAHAVVGGQPHELAGNFYEPTILTNVTNTMRISQEEIFGPIAPLFQFHTEQEVIDLANNTTAGLAGYFYSRDIGRIWRVAEQLEYGMIGINSGIVSTVQAPFGGIKESGLGREGSILGMDEYTEVKYLCIGGLKRE